MATDILVSLISAAGGIASALVGQVPIKSLFSSRARRRSNVPPIVKTKWRAQWKYDDDSPTITDHVTFREWTTGNQFEGFGEVEHNGKLYIYSLSGEVSPMRIVALTYKAGGAQAYFGTACLQLSTVGMTLTGNFVGYEGRTQSDGPETFKLHSGVVKMDKVADI